MEKRGGRAQHGIRNGTHSEARNEDNEDNALRIEGGLWLYCQRFLPYRDGW